ncbi:hypothetical protein WME95_08780 [Sorangium sp. So ce327]|uniref:RCC1 domain-containing protein n=1 Tax=Sorangium sp. So ce327 TaxID=3133301 RepID=UPI003F643B0B
MPRSLVAPFLYVVALPAALAACGYVEIAPHGTSGGSGGGAAVTGTGGGAAVTGSGGGAAVTGSGGGAAVAGSGGGAAVTGTGGAGAGGEDAPSTGSTSTSTGPAPAPSCAAAECAVRIAEGAPNCAITASGKVFCWWRGVFRQERLAGPVERPGLGDVVAASNHPMHMCFLHADGRVSCQGSDINGPLLLRSIPEEEISEVPVVLPELEGVVQLSVGYEVACGVLGSGNVLCWGDPFSPLLGVEGAGRMEAPVPVTVTGVDDAVQVGASHTHTCALRGTGDVVCWGRLTTGETTDTAVRVEGVEGAVEIAAGWSNDCARLATGKVVCWGSDGSSSHAEPVEVPGLDDAIQVSAGYSRYCALRQGGRVVCWRFSARMTLEAIDIPEAVHVTAGYKEACAALASGEIACWPTNNRDVYVFGL